MRQQLPTSPGVYSFLNKSKQVIYVGKAKNLSNRIRSYHQVGAEYLKTRAMLSKAKFVSWIELDSELEAITIEARLVKTHQPKYNVNLKDDKSALYILLTNQDFPRVKLVRKKQLATTYSDIKSTSIFGPFASVSTARKILKIARRTFKFCNAKNKQNQKNRACFYVHLDLCDGACVGKVSQEEYKRKISQLKLFLSGRKKTLLRQLKSEMNSAAQNQDFELAAKKRDQVKLLEHYYQHQNKPDFDPEMPLLFEDIQQHTNNRLTAFLHTVGIIPVKYSLERIEAYDISNTQGDLSVASMVVFEHGRPAPSEYRQFKIRGFKQANDPGSLAETLQRRMKHPEWAKPDLLVIDGGKTQLKAVLKQTANWVPTISIAKNPDRLFVAHKIDNDWQFRSYKLPEGKPVTRLIQQLRDEAHRFAQRYHKKLRRSDMLKT